jgi:hypothetical protein
MGCAGGRIDSAIQHNSTLHHCSAAIGTSVAPIIRTPGLLRKQALYLGDDQHVKIVYLAAACRSILSALAIGVS